MPSNHLTLCRPLLLPPSVFPSIRAFSSESVLHIRWLKYWIFSFSISPFNEYSGLILLRLTSLISLQSKGLSRVFSNTTVQENADLQKWVWTASLLFNFLDEFDKDWYYFLSDTVHQWSHLILNFSLLGGSDYRFSLLTGNLLRFLCVFIILMCFLFLESYVFSKQFNLAYNCL